MQSKSEPALPNTVFGTPPPKALIFLYQQSFCVLVGVLLQVRSRVTSGCRLLEGSQFAKFEDNNDTVKEKRGKGEGGRVLVSKCVLTK